MCWLLASTSTMTVILQMLFVPDTSHHRSRYAEERETSGKRWIFEWEAVNPLRCLETLKDPKVLMIVS